MVFIILLEFIPLHHVILLNALLCSLELNILDAGRSRSMCGVIVVDAESFGLFVTDVMPIFMIIALDIFITMHFSINCSTVICSPTVILMLSREKPLVKPMAPGSIFYIIFSDL